MKNLSKAIFAIGIMMSFQYTFGQVEPSDCKGYVENCLNFEGVDIFDGDYVEMGDVLDMGTGDFTLEAWIRVESNGHAMMIINKGLSASGFPQNAGYSLRVHGTQNQLDFIVRGNGGASITKSASYSNIDTWHHVAATKSETNGLNLYIDGVVVSGGATAVTAGTNLDTDLDFTVGAMSKDTDQNYFFNGDIDEVRIWNVERTATEIADHYDNYFCTLPSSLLSYYHMNENDAGATNTGDNTLTDFAGTNNGTLHNFSLAGVASNWVTGYDMDTPHEVLDASIYVSSEILYANVTTHATYQWIDCKEPSDISGETGTSMDPGPSGANVGSGSYSLAVEDGCCKETSCCLQIELGVQKMANPDASGPTIEDVSDDFKLYPNPVKDKISIEFLEENEQLENVTIIIYDALGRNVKSIDKIDSKIQSFDLKSLDPGAYILSVIFPTHEQSYKFIKE